MFAWNIVIVCVKQILLTSSSNLFGINCRKGQGLEQFCKFLTLPLNVAFLFTFYVCVCVCVCVCMCLCVLEWTVTNKLDQGKFQFHGHYWSYLSRFKQTFDYIEFWQKFIQHYSRLLLQNCCFGLWPWTVRECMQWSVLGNSSMLPTV